MGNESLSGAVSEQRRVEHDGARWKLRKPGQQLAQRQRRQVGKRETILIGTEFLSRLGQKVGVELRRSSNHHDLFRVRLQVERKLEGRREFTFQKNAGHIGWQRAGGQLSFVDPAEHDRRSGKDQLSVVQQEVQRGTQDGNCHVDLPAGVFGAKVVAEERYVRRRAEAGEIHALAVDLHGFR